MKTKSVWPVIGGGVAFLTAGVIRVYTASEAAGLLSSHLESEQYALSDTLAAAHRELANEIYAALRAAENRDFEVLTPLIGDADFDQ